MQRGARSRVDIHVALIRLVVKLDALYIRQGFRQIIGIFVQVTAALFDHVIDRISGFRTGPERVFIGVDFYRIGWHVAHHRQLSQCRLVIEWQRRPGGQDSCNSPKITAGKPAPDKIGAQFSI